MSISDQDPNDEAYQAALAYDTVVVPRYARPIADVLLSVVDIPARAYILDLSCRTGYTAIRLLTIARDGRVIAIDEDSTYLDIARMRAGADAGKRLFAKQERPESLPFGEDVFSNVVGNLIDRATSDRPTMLGEVARVLRPKGQLALTLPLRGSFAEVIDVFREVALKYDMPRVMERVEQYVHSLPTPEMWQMEVESRGFEAARVTQRAFTLDYPPGHGILRDPATLVAAVPEWQWCAEGAGDNASDVLYRVEDAIATYFEGRTFETTVVAGCLIAKKT